MKHFRKDHTIGVESIVAATVEHGDGLVKLLLETQRKARKLGVENGWVWRELEPYEGMEEFL